MKFSIATVLAFAAAVLAKPEFINRSFQVEEGKPFTLKWINAQGPVTVTLMNGPPPKGLKPVRDIATGVTGTEFIYTPTDLPSDLYTFRISDSSSEPNYSSSFQYVGTGTLTSTSVSSTTSSGSSSTSSAASSTSSTLSASNSTSSTSTTIAPTPTRQTQPTNTPQNTNNAQRFASPLTLVLVTVAALVFFH